MDRYTSVTPAEVGAMSGLIGAGIGYTLAPRKYNLEQILTQKPDIFKKSIPKNLVENSGSKQKAAYNVLKNGRKLIRDAVKNNTQDAKLAELLQTPMYENCYKTLKGFIPKARVQTAIVLAIIGGLTGALSKIAFFNKN